MRPPAISGGAAPTSYLRPTIIAVLALAALAALLLQHGGQPAQAQSTVGIVAVDTDISGNGGDTNGGFLLFADECNVITDVGETLQIDVIVDGVPADRGMSGFGFFLTFDPSIVHVTASSSALSLLGLDPDSSILNAGDTISADGSFNAGWADFGGYGIDVPPFMADGMSSETGPGVLLRLTLTAQATGTTPLDLSRVGIPGDDLDPITIDSVQSGEVVVGLPVPPGCAPGDPDDDGFISATELTFGSDPLDANSVPEAEAANPGSCTDLTDNDLDGPIDAADPGCDPDGDGVPDPVDNCPGTANPGQENNVHPETSAGDHCEDPDSDTVFDITDNCPDVANMGQADADSDDHGDVCDTCPHWPNPTQALPPWPVPSEDPDCDGFDSTAETFVGTLPLKQCADNTVRNNEHPDPWPADLDDDQDTDIFDVLSFKPVFGSSSPDPSYSPRHDVDQQDGDVDIFDVLAIKPFFGVSCT